MTYLLTFAITVFDVAIEKSTVIVMTLCCFCQQNNTFYIYTRTGFLVIKQTVKGTNVEGKKHNCNARLTVFLAIMMTLLSVKNKFFKILFFKPVDEECHLPLFRTLLRNPFISTKNYFQNCFHIYGDDVRSFL